MDASTPSLLDPQRIDPGAGKPYDRKHAPQYDSSADAAAERRRGIILQTIGRVAEYLLNAAAWEHKIERGLAELGEAVGVSRTYIFEIHPAADGEVLASQRHEWVPEGVAPQIGNEELQNLPLRAAGFARWEERLSAGETIQGHVREFPESERRILEMQEIRSLLVVPIFAGTRWWGFMGFDECRGEREWSAAETEALRTAAGILGGAIRHERTAAALQQSEERYRRLVEQSPDAIAVHRDGEILYVNSATLRLLGVEAWEHVVGRSIFHFIHAADHGRARQRMSMSSAQRSTEPMELRLCRADGTTVPVEVTSVDVHFDESDASQVVLRDITLRKHAEEDARELISEQAARAAAEAAEQRARFLAEAGSILGSSLDYRTTLRSVARLAITSLADSCVVFVVEEDGQIRGVEVAHTDPAKEAMLRELIRRDPPDPRAPRSPSARVLRTGEAVIIPQLPEEWIYDGDPGPEHLELCRRVLARSLMCVPLIGRGRVLGTISFGTETPGRSFGPEDLALARELASRAALAIDNARLYYEAQQASQAKSEFMAVMSHELKNPLTAVTTYAELLREEVVGPLSPVQKQQLDVIAANSFHLAQLIDEVLAYTRAEAERIEVRRERIETGGLARQLMEWIRPMAEAKGLALVLQLPPEPAVVDTDATRLRQIVVNLLTNAVRFTDRGSITLTVEQGGEKVWICVADTGIGIAPEYQDKIFEPFWQVDRSYTRRSGGTGLGLSVVQRLTQLLGGGVTVQSVPGEGSTFAVWLPTASA